MVTETFPIEKDVYVIDVQDLDHQWFEFFAEQYEHLIHNGTYFIFHGKNLVNIHQLMMMMNLQFI